jgi:hypothetical protein
MTNPATQRPAPLAVGEWHCYICPKCGAGITAEGDSKTCIAVQRDGATCGATLSKSAPTLIEALAKNRRHVAIKGDC